MVVKVQKYEVIIDDCDINIFNLYKWTSSKTEQFAYIYTKTKPAMALHRLILNIKDKNIKVDHINMNPLDNRKCNLRLCIKPGQNEMNRPKQTNNKVGYKGVSFRKDRNKYRAVVTLNKKQYFIGHFDDPIEAAKAYDKKAKELFGEFAFLNFPEEI